MGKALYESDDPAFRDAMDRCASAYDNAVAAAHGGNQPPAHQGLLDLLGYRGSSNVPSTIDNTRFAQPAILALGFSLAEMWRSRGVEPSIVLGHSIGEIAAACVAGAFTIEAAMRLTVARGIAMSAIDNTQSDGVMVAARVAPSDVRTAVEAVVKRMGSVVSIAAANGPIAPSSSLAPELPWLPSSKTSSASTSSKPEPSRCPMPSTRRSSRRPRIPSGPLSKPSRLMAWSAQHGCPWHRRSVV